MANKNNTINSTIKRRETASHLEVNSTSSSKVFFVPKVHPPATVNECEKCQYHEAERQDRDLGWMCSKCYDWVSRDWFKFLDDSE